MKEIPAWKLEEGMIVEVGRRSGPSLVWTFAEPVDGNPWRWWCVIDGTRVEFDKEVVVPFLGVAYKANRGWEDPVL